MDRSRNKIHLHKPESDTESMCGIVQKRKALFLTTYQPAVTCQFCIKHLIKKEIIQHPVDKLPWIKKTDHQGNEYWIPA